MFHKQSTRVRRDKTRRPLSSGKEQLRTTAKGPIQRNRGIFIALACLCCLLVGLGLGYVLVPAPVPQSLRAAEPLTSVTIGHETFDDAQTVKVTPNVTYGQPLTWRGSGVVTGITVSNGEILNSGTTFFQVDGMPIIALYTAVPLYRDLTTDAVGPDVGALRDELGRLGYAVSPSSGDHNRYDWSLQQAVRELQRSNGLSGDLVDGNINLARIVWIPQTSLTLSDSALVWGQDAPQQIGASSTTLASLTVTMPSELAPGKRLVIMSNTQTSLPENGVITDATFLDAVRQSDEFRQWLTLPAEQRKNLDAAIQLQEPVDALRVPAGSVFGIRDDDSACIQSHGRKIPVTLYGTLNGYAMVVPSRHAKPSTVDISSAITDSSCPVGTQKKNVNSSSPNKKEADDGTHSETAQ